VQLDLLGAHGCLLLGHRLLPYTCHTFVLHGFM
jgi:hypothetical protein